MAKMAGADDLGRKIDQLRKAPPEVDPAQVRELVEETVKSVSGDISLAEVALYHELDTLSKVIQAAKREIWAVRPDDISSQHIPQATDELDAVVMATAEATGQILDSAEALEKLGATLPPLAARQVTEHVTRIFEACNFQDITGQRITKVVKTLNYIESKIGALLAAFGEQIGDMPAAPVVDERVGDAKLLNGPQLPQAANSQSEIDALLADLF
jgi:chemotaxis protein CheZ